MLTQYVICYAAICSILSCLAIFVLAVNPRRHLNRIYSSLCLLIAWWAFWSIPLILTQDSSIAVLWCRLALSGPIFIPTVYLHFCILFIEEEERYRALKRLTYGISWLLLLTNTTPLFIKSVSPRFSLLNYTDPGFFFHLHLIHFFWAIGVSTLLLFRKWSSLAQQGDRIRERHLRLFLISALIGYVGGMSAYLLAYNIEVPGLLPFGQYTVALYGIVAAFSILRYQFLDIKVVVTRTGLLLAIYLIVLGAPFMVGWWGKAWLNEQLGDEWWLVPLGLCTILATLGPFAYAYLRRQAETRLLKEQRRYQRTLQLASRGMTQVRNVERLANLITRLVSRTVGMTHASLFLWDEAHQRYSLKASHGPSRLSPQSRYGLELGHPLVRWLCDHQKPLTPDDMLQQSNALISQETSKFQGVLVIPGMMEHRLIGLLVLGPKRSGEGYSNDDLHAFSTLANEAAVAIENATSYEELLRVNEQLKAASERLLLQERLAAAGQFAAGMAHEIKNPLSAIKTFAQYLPEKYSDPAFRDKFFRIVQAEIDRINALVKDLSDFAKPAPLELKPVHLADALEDTLALLAPQFMKHHVVLHKSLNENGLCINADQQQLKQVVLNLLLNSIEAMESGGRIELATQAGRDAMVLRITDTGCGIEPRELYKVWDPFFTTKERGMGLGMAIVKGVVERHGGRITISSAVGKGTTVEISLPLACS